MHKTARSETDIAPDDADRRLQSAELFARRLDGPMSVLGILFLFVVLAQLLAESEPLLTALGVVGWICWAIFVGEFLLRAYIARFQSQFFKRNWWQIIFLLVPFLRFFRALQALRFWRIARLWRFGSVVSAGIRGSRSAGRLLSNRIGWLAVLTGVVILVSSQLLYVFESYENYAPALQDAAMATITGEPLSAPDGFAKMLQVLLAVYSVAVFATLAGAVGAYFLRGDDPRSAQSKT